LIKLPVKKRFNVPKTVVLAPRRDTDMAVELSIGRIEHLSGVAEASGPNNRVDAASAWYRTDVNVPD
jgi:hypothetical protein